MSRFERLALALAATMLIAGCATPVAPTVGEPPSRWSGRFAVTWIEPADPPREERASGSFSLRASGGTTELDVFSPFGQTVAHAVAGPRGAVLETSDGKRHEADDPDVLTEQVLGWRIPVGRLPDWLRITTRAGSAAAPFVDSGWSISPDEGGDGGARRRLTLRWPVGGEAANARRVTIRLVLDVAELPATSLQ
jgi:outer membrane lipoprotein LolB